MFAAAGATCAATGENMNANQALIRLRSDERSGTPGVPERRKRGSGVTRFLTLALRNSQAARI